MFDVKNEEKLFEFTEKGLAEVSSIVSVSVNKDFSDIEMNKVIQIIDTTGEEVSCTMDKFVEIFDTQGLSGFIM